MNTKLTEKGIISKIMQQTSILFVLGIIVCFPNNGVPIDVQNLFMCVIIVICTSSGCLQLLHSKVKAGLDTGIAPDEIRPNSDRANSTVSQYECGGASSEA